MKALVIGATGATGKPLVENLLNDPFFEEVIVFVRKAPAAVHEKLTVHVVDFNAMEQWRDLITGDVVFSCMGTTIKEAKTKANQWKIDYEYPYQFAKYAKENGCNTHVLVSSYGASSQSRMFYPQMKGKLEEAIKALDYSCNIVFQPGVLIRKDTDRAMEQLSVGLIRFLNRLGIYRSYEPLPTEDLAYAMIAAAKQNTSGDHVYALDAIKKTWLHKG